MFVRSALKCAQESSNKFEAYDGGGKGSEGRAPNPRAGGSFLWNASLGCGPLQIEARGVLELGIPISTGHLSWEGPKVAICGTFQKQTTMPMQTTELKKRPLRTKQVFLAGVNRLIYNMGHLRSGMGLSCSNRASQAKVASIKARDLPFRAHDKPC